MQFRKEIANEIRNLVDLPKKDQAWWTAEEMSHILEKVGIPSGYGVHDFFANVPGVSAQKANHTSLTKENLTALHKVVQGEMFGERYSFREEVVEEPEEQLTSIFSTSTSSTKLIYAVLSSMDPEDQHRVKSVEVADKVLRNGLIITVKFRE